MGKYSILATLFLGILIGGCLSDSGNSIKIKVAGSTTVLPVVSKAAEEFNAANPDVFVMVSAGGSGVGVKMVGSRLADIGMISRDITEEEKMVFKDTDFKEYIIGRDAVAVMVSSEVYNSGVRALSMEQLRDIYSGRIENWAEVGGPDQEILVIDKESARGTRQVFMKAVFGDIYAKAEGADIVVGSNNEEQTAIAQSDAAIGMLSIAWGNEDVKAVSVILDGKAIEPNLDNVKSGLYPISRGLKLITSGEPSGKVKDFVDFILSEKGQRIVEASGYVAIH